MENLQLIILSWFRSPIVAKKRTLYTSKLGVANQVAQVLRVLRHFFGQVYTAHRAAAFVAVLTMLLGVMNNWIENYLSLGLHMQSIYLQS
jgi:hypothetical protein